MGSVPTVTITVTGAGAMSGAPLSKEERIEALHMYYVQAVKGDQRKQWILFPPAYADLGAEGGDPTGQALLLNRTQEFPGNRSKWFRQTIAPKDPNNGLSTALTQHEADGWVISGHTVVPLEHDDYVNVWTGETPHKAIRAIDRAIRPLGLQTK